VTQPCSLTLMSDSTPNPDRLLGLAALAPEAEVARDAVTTQPSGTLYGGAQRFKVGALAKLGDHVQSFFQRHVDSDDAFVACFGVPTATSVATLRERLRASLQRAPLEDVRVDFEDGYGPHGDDEEDAHARLVGEALAEKRTTGWPQRVGVRVRALESGTAKRALRTLTIVVDTMVAAGWRPGREPFRVTLPKVTHLQELAMAARALERLEADHELPERSFVVEAMVETPEALLDREGRVPLVLWPGMARGRLGALHFGAFDYLSSLGVPARSQSLDHPACLHARASLALGAARAGIEVSDGTFLEIPVGPHREAIAGSIEEQENQEIVARALRHHAERVRRQLAEGYAQGWDLHPGQVVSRRAALLTAYVEGRDDVLRRMDGFLSAGARAARSGTAFDDAASARSLLATLRRGIRLGLDDADLVAVFLGLEVDDLLRAPLFELPKRRRRSS
jgi:citrate lyase beta subunit